MNLEFSILIQCVDQCNENIFLNVFTSILLGMPLFDCVSAESGIKNSANVTVA